MVTRIERNDLKQRHCCESGQIKNCLVLTVVSMKPKIHYNFQRWMSRFPQRWRTQRNAIRNANCKTSWIIKILNAHCAFGIFPVACLSECLWISLSVGVVLWRYVWLDVVWHWQWTISFVVFAGVLDCSDCRTVVMNVFDRMKVLISSISGSFVVLNDNNIWSCDMTWDVGTICERC